LVAIVNEADVQPQQIGKRATRRAMLTAEAAPATRVIADRITLEAGGSCKLDVPDTGLGWMQVLAGSVTVQCGEQASLTDTCVALLPPASRFDLSSDSGAELLYALVPRAAELDERFMADPPRFKVVDWSREPVLDSKHDSRQRVYVATPGLFNTRAIKAEIISYPRRTTGSNHHHEGAEHFAYVISGSTTGYADEAPHRYRAGDSFTTPMANGITRRPVRTRNIASPNSSCPAITGRSGRTRIESARGFRRGAIHAAKRRSARSARMIRDRRR